LICAASIDLCRVDRDCRHGQVLPEQLLGDHPAERMADQHGAGVQVADYRREMVHDVVDSLVGDRVGIGPGEVDGVLIARPARRQDTVSRLLEHGLPRAPGARVQPEAVYEYRRMSFFSHLIFRDLRSRVRPGIALNVRRSPRRRLRSSD
jgi:hypothetical protein